MMAPRKSRFVKVKCRCGNTQVIFGSASTKVKCNSCSRVLAAPTGGKARIQTKILKVLERG